MRAYQILKSNSLEIMGIYHANSKKEAVNKMAKRGVLVGKEWEHNYIAIPAKEFKKSYKPNVK